MDKPGGHRTGLNAHFGVDTGILRNASRNWLGISGADAAPKPSALLVDNADRGRLLRYVQPNIMRHRNLRWCKPPGNMPGSRHYRCLRLRTAITRGPHKPLAQLVRKPPRRDRRPAAPGNLGAQARQCPAAIVARILGQDRHRNRPGMRPDLGLLSWPRAPPQPRHPAMRKVTSPVTHRTDVHPENRGDLPGP